MLFLMDSEASLIDRITLYKGDITQQQDVDAIVCTIHADLTLRGSLNKAVFQAAGQALDDDLLEHIVKPRAGDVFVLPGYDLPMPHIIFTVMPVWRDDFDRDDAYIVRSYRRAMETAHQMGLKKIAFPVIGTGHMGYPLERAARMAYRGISDRIIGLLDEVRIVCNRDETFQMMGRRLQKNGWKAEGHVQV